MVGKQGLLKERRRMMEGMGVAVLARNVDNTPSWVLGGSESSEAEQEYLEREQRDERMWVQITESIRSQIPGRTTRRSK